MRTLALCLGGTHRSERRAPPRVAAWAGPARPCDTLRRALSPRGAPPSRPLSCDCRREAPWLLRVPFLCQRARRVTATPSGDSNPGWRSAKRKETRRATLRSLLRARLRLCVGGISALRDRPSLAFTPMKPHQTIGGVSGTFQLKAFAFAHCTRLVSSSTSHLSINRT